LSPLGRIEIYRNTNNGAVGSLGYD